MKNVDVLIDEKTAENTGFTGEASFILSEGSHYVEVLINNKSCFNTTLIVTKPQVFKLDISDSLPLSTTAPTITPISNNADSDNSNPAFAILMFALTGVVLVFIVVRRRSD